MESHNSDSTHLNNRFLVAMPQLQDRLFAQSVTYLCEHDENGAFGLVVNKPLGVDLSQIFVQLNITPGADFIDQPVLAGGPVHIEQGFILHKDGGDWKHTAEVADNLYLTTSLDILESIANGHGPEEYLVTLGCASWGKGQLDDEMLANSWLTCNVSDEVLFHLPHDARASAAAQIIGIDLSLLSPDVGHA
ncbi:MAG: YqgE/AlgH family protein [Pseudomonadales bacterium]|nr:YqgE/AlgH family protein [Pseudomonadales bacterium]